MAAPLNRVEDDREKLTGNDRLILIVEDDPAFSRNSSADLTHELNFKCLIAATAEEGLTLAVQYLPSAVLLDLGFPITRD